MPKARVRTRVALPRTTQWLQAQTTTRFSASRRPPAMMKSRRRARGVPPAVSSRLAFSRSTPDKWPLHAQAYRKLAMKHHPDKNPANRAAAEKKVREQSAHEGAQRLSASSAHVTNATTRRLCLDTSFYAPPTVQRGLGSLRGAFRPAKEGARPATAVLLELLSAGCPSPASVPCCPGDATRETRRPWRLCCVMLTTIR